MHRSLAYSRGFSICSICRSGVQERGLGWRYGFGRALALETIMAFMEVTELVHREGRWRRGYSLGQKPEHRSG